MATKTLETKKVQHTGIMNKMRDKMPLIIIILIVAFLATIVFEWGMNYLGLSSPTEAFAKINGTEISYQDFERIVQQQVEQMRQQNPNQEIDESSLNQVREQVWNSLVSQTITKEAIERYGIQVTDREILDWIYNRPETLPEPIKRNFMDSTGVFNTAAYQQALTMKSKEAVKFWSDVENFLRETLLSEKLQGILTEGAVVTEGDVLQKYKDDNIIAGFNYVLLDLNTVTDTNQFAVTEQEMKNYYDNNKNEFKQEESVKLKYVNFPEVATAEDTTYLKRELESYRKDMQEATLEDSSLIKLVNENSTTPFNGEYQKTNSLDPKVTSFLFNASPGDVSEVVMTNNGFQIVKMLEEKESEEIYVNASHILVNFGTDTAQAKQKAEDLFNRVKAGEDINKLASEISDDPSAKQNNGDLGWFAKGAMVKEFEEAAFNNPIGQVVGPVKTNFGFHVIKVTGKEKKEFKVATISKTVTPSNKSKQIVRKKAEDFYAELENGQNFDSLAKRFNVEALTSQEITKDGAIPLAGSNKTILAFAFDNKVNSFSEPVKVQGGVALYQVMNKTSEGYQNFDSIKVSVIKPKLINEKKFQVLTGVANDLEGKIQGGDLFSLKNIAPLYSYETVDSFSVSKPDEKIGQDYALSNAISSMKLGDISKPIKGVKGVYIIKLNSITEFNQEDYVIKAPGIMKTLLSQKRQSIISDWLAKMQSEADIIDNRSKYF